jgi:hypothetical protein
MMSMGDDGEKSKGSLYRNMSVDHSDTSESESNDDFVTVNHFGSSKKRRRKTLSSRSFYSAPNEAESSAESFVSPYKLKGENSSIPSLQIQSRENSLDNNNFTSRSKLFSCTDSEDNNVLNIETTTSIAVEGLPYKEKIKESSLFGNVMKNVSATLGIGTSSSIPASMGPPTTPARSQQPLGMHKFSSTSPGGFHLLDFVNGFGNSPLFHRFSNSSKAQHAHLRTPVPTQRNTAENSKTPDSQQPPVVQAPLSLATPRRDVEWHECCVGQWMTDWSLKSTLEIQCHPCIPELHDDFLQLALQQFVCGGKTNLLHNSNDNDDLSTALMKFHAALCYWQHPAVHPLSNEFFCSSGHNQQPSLLKSDSAMNKRKGTLLHGDGGNSNSNSSRHVMPPPKTSMRAFSATSTYEAPSRNRTTCNSIDAFVQLRAKEWQASFRSLYHIWEQKIHSLNSEWAMNGRMDDNTIEFADLIKTVSETYFYALGKGHTILFRVGSVRNKSNDVDTDEFEATFQLVPEIVISSSSQSLRTKLSSMGVELSLLNGWNGHTGVFDEEWLLGSEGSRNGADGVTQDVTASPNVLAELVELRRAQMCGWNVGADVAVSLKPKNVHRQGFNGISPKQVPPLLISGINQCASFSTLYCNALGQMGVASFGRPMQAEDLSLDVPLLICRKMGPFLHGSIKSVVPYQKEQHTRKSAFNVLTTMEGCLLPCAVRDLVCATISFALAHKASGKTTQMIETSSKADEDKESHHFVVKMSVHPGDELKTLNATGMIGSHSSKFLNGPWSFLQFLDDPIATQNCQCDEVLNTIVWDTSHPESVAIKLDHLSSFKMK